MTPTHADPGVDVPNSESTGRVLIVACAASALTMLALVIGLVRLFN